METPGLGHPLALGSRSAGADEDQAAKPSGLPPRPPTHPHRRLPLTGTLCCGKQGKRQSPGLITAAGAALLTNDSAAPASPPLQATGTRAPPKVFLRCAFKRWPCFSLNVSRASIPSTSLEPCSVSFLPSWRVCEETEPRTRGSVSGRPARVSGGLLPRFL